MHKDNLHYKDAEHRDVHNVYGAPGAAVACICPTLPQLPPALLWGCPRPLLLCTAAIHAVAAAAAATSALPPPPLILNRPFTRSAGYFYHMATADGLR